MCYILCVLQVLHNCGFCCQILQANLSKHTQLCFVVCLFFVFFYFSLFCAERKPNFVLPSAFFISAWFLFSEQVNDWDTENSLCSSTFSHVAPSSRGMAKVQDGHTNACERYGICKNISTSGWLFSSVSWHYFSDLQKIILLSKLKYYHFMTTNITVFY